MQQPNLFPFGSVLGNPFLLNGGVGDLSDGGFDSSRVFFLVPFLLFQGGGMDLSKVGEKLLSSVRSARSLGLLPSSPSSDRPEVPARAAAAAAVARALSGLPPDQRYSLPSSSEELMSIYGSKPQSQIVEDVEEKFYEEEFDPIKHVLEHIPSDENELEYFEKQATLRLAQLDRVAEQLSRNVMEHHEVMVKGMNLVRELEKDLKIANVICRNGRRHLTSSMNEVSRDLVVNTDSKKKQALMHLLPVLAELLHARDMQVSLESLVEEGNFCKAFQVLSEYLQLLDSFSELSAIQEMSRGVEVWLGRTLQKLDSLLLGVCQEFKEEGYLTVVDAYALIGDVSGLAEKIQSFFMQEVISETHSVLKSIILYEDQDVHMQNSRLTYSDLCLQIPESKFRQCLLRTLAVLFKIMCSYHEIMGFQLENKVLECPVTNAKLMKDGIPGSSSIKESTTATSSADTSGRMDSGNVESDKPVSDGRNGDGATSSSGSPWYQLRKEAITFVSQTLQRGRKNLWQLMTSRVSVLLSASAAASTSIHQFLKNYEDLSTFILAGEAFCGVEAFEFRQKLKGVCGNYFAAFHRQNVFALKMVLERETWLRLPPETAQIISFAGLVGDGAPLIAASDGRSSNSRVLRADKLANKVDTGAKKSGFSPWLRNGNPFLLKVSSSHKEAHNSSPLNGTTSVEYEGNADNIHGDVSPRGDENHINGANSISEEENEDLLADFIDEDSQLPSRISKPNLSRNYSPHFSNDDFTAQTGSSLCLLRSMDKYARLMQKLEIVNVEFFKGICQLFEMFFYFVFETFGLQNMNSSGKTLTDSLNYRLKTALSQVTQDWNLCCSNGWCYGVFWRFDPRNSMLLTLGDAYYEQKMGPLVDKMLLKFHILGEGIIGQAAFTGKHQWIFSDSNGKGSDSAGNENIFQDESELQDQFSSGIKTIAVISVGRRGVVQFGSTKKILERLELLAETEKLFYDMGNCHGLTPLEIETCNLDGWFTSFILGQNPTTELGGCSGKPTGWSCSLQSLIEPSCSVHDYSMNTVQQNLSHLTSQIQTISMEAQPISTGKIHRVNSLAANAPCTSEGSILTSLPSEKGEWDPSIAFPKKDTEQNFQGHSTFTSFYSTGELVDVELRNLDSFGRTKQEQHSFGTNAGLLDSVISQQRSIEDFNLGDFTTDLSSSFTMDDFSQWFSPFPQHHILGAGATTTTDPSCSVGFTSVPSVPIGGDAVINIPVGQIVNSSKSSIADAFTSNVEKSTMVHDSGNDLFSVTGMDFRLRKAGGFSENIDMPLLHSVNKVVASGMSSSMAGKRKGLFSELGLEELLRGVNNSSSVAKSSVEDEIFTTRRRKIENSSSNFHLGQLEGLSCSGGGMNLAQYSHTWDKSNDTIFGKEFHLKSQVGLWIDDSYGVKAGNAVVTTAKKPTRKRAKPGESSRPRPKDRQLIQDRIKELRGIIPHSGKQLSIDHLLERTIKYLLFLQGVTKYADKIKQADEPKLIGQENGKLLKHNTMSGGATWAFEVGAQSIPIVVKDLNPPGQMLVEMLCEDREFFLEIAEVIRGFPLNILKGVMELQEDKIWARFIVEADKQIERTGIIWSLLPLLQQKDNSGIDCATQPSGDMDGGISLLNNPQQQPFLLRPVSVAETLQ